MSAPAPAVGDWHCTACHRTLPADAASTAGACPRTADGEHTLYVQLGQGHPNGWDGSPCSCVRQGGQP